jgi:hypothetical protein
MRRSLAWVVSVAVTSISTLGGHFLTYRLSYADERVRAHALEASGHGYFAYAPLFLSVCGGALAAALLLSIGAAARSGPARRLPWWPFVALPAFVFVAQEHLERFVHHGDLPLDLLGQPPFLIGLALQIPLGFAAAEVVRALLAAADTIGTVLRARRPVHHGAALEAPLNLARRDGVAPIPALATGHAGRAPPPRR